MPVYEYRCTNCQKIFEYQQRMADAPRTECEECRGALERLISRSSFSFKGGGWYKDLYSSAKPDVGAKADGGAKATESSSDSSGAKSSDAGAAASSSTTTPSGGTSSGSGSSASSTSAA
jgi:putative FmdB family regulatory protein